MPHSIPKMRRSGTARSVLSRNIQHLVASIDLKGCMCVCCLLLQVICQLYPRKCYFKDLYR
jgi:hypothetical protein